MYIVHKQSDMYGMYYTTYSFSSTPGILAEERLYNA